MQAARIVLWLGISLFTLTLARAAEEPVKWEVEIEGLKREALVYAPASAKAKPAPLVFAFHGHGGTALAALRKFDLPNSWPEAISVYMQGVKTPSPRDPEGARNGWQRNPGEVGDRDLKFFDAVLTRLRGEFKVDAQRIFSTGHSNGGGFTYLLWSERGDLFAGMAPCCSAHFEPPLKFKPKPVMHVAGEKDTTSPFPAQQQAMQQERLLNGCLPEGREIAHFTTLYSSPTGLPAVTYVHPGGHELPAEAAAQVSKFFQGLAAAAK